DLLRLLAHLVQRFRDLHAAALAAAAGVDLRLHHPDAAAEFFRRLDRFVDAEARESARRDHAEFAEQFFALVLVDFHAAKSPLIQSSLASPPLLESLTCVMSSPSTRAPPVHAQSSSTKPASRSLRRSANSSS